VPAQKINDEFRVDIEIRGFGPFDAFGLDLDYDQTKVEFVSCQRSPFTVACPPEPCFDELTCFNNPVGGPAGSVRIGGISSNGNETPDPTELLCQVEFRPLSTAGGFNQMTTMNFTADFGGVGVPNCKGTVTFDPQGTGDVNNDNALDPNDWVCAFRCFLSAGNITLSPFSLCDLAAFTLEGVRSDVNCDNNCTVSDANGIRDRYLQCGGVPSHCFLSDGTPCPGPARDLPVRVDELRMGDGVVIARGEVMRIPLQARGAGNLDLFGFELSYSPGLEVIALEPSSTSADWVAFGAGLARPGLVRAGGFGGQVALSSNDWTDLGYFVVRARSDAAATERFDLVELFDNLEQARYLGGEISVRDGATPLPSEFLLGAGRPNPSSGSVRIDYAIPSGEAQRVEIKVYNLHGQVVKTLVDRVQDSGRHEVIWEGDDETGQRVVSGTYFYRMVAGDFDETRKMVRLASQ
jgi:hypothetical protein